MGDILDLEWVLGSLSEPSSLYTGANRSSESTPYEHTVKKRYSWKEKPSFACFGSCTLRVVMTGTCEPPARPPPPQDCFLTEIWALAVGFELPTHGADADVNSRSIQHHVMGQPAALGM